MTDINELLSVTNRKPLDKRPFSIMARVAMQLGRESISNSITAITELVKNSYDADAENVHINFSGLSMKKATLPDSFLVIDDDGIGMTYSELVNNWLTIGTTNKLVEANSGSKKRVLTGEKGLGRLGLDRLCSKTILRTFTEDKDEGTELIIDWQKYEKTDNTLGNVEHEIFSLPKRILDPITHKYKTFKRGTQLILFGLKDSWDSDYLEQLKNELTLLVSPFAGLNDFSVYLDTGLNIKNIDGKIGSEYMLEAAEWVVKAEILEDGTLLYKMTSPSLPEEFVLSSVRWNKRFKDAKTEMPACGILKFDLYFFPRKEVTLSELTLKRKHIDDFLDANQGIRIYRDNFRVKPYGEPDGSGDWLRLSFRRQQSPAGVTQDMGSWRVGYNQVVGAVFLTREKNPLLIDQTNREGIVEGPGFFDLKKFAEDVVRFFEINRQKYEKSNKEITKVTAAKNKAKRSTDASAAAVEKLIGLTKEVTGKHGKQIDAETVDNLSFIVNDLAKKVEKAQRDQENFVDVVEKVQQDLQSQKDTLGNLASLGILAHAFGHETLASSNLVVQNADYLRDDLERGVFMVSPDVRVKLNDELEILLYEASKIENFAKFTIGNVRRDNRHRTKVYLNEVIFGVFAYFEKILSEKNISIDLTNVPKDGIPPILAFRIDWESILINFITNAVWALHTIPANYRQIRVGLILEEMNTSKYLRLAFGDSGIGLDEGTDEQIFLPTISTRRNDKGEIIGTGMGLAIVKGLVSSYDDGKVSVIPNCDLGGAEFFVSIRVPELNERGRKKDV